MNLSTDRDRIDALLVKLPEIHTLETSKGLTAHFSLAAGIVTAKELLSGKGGRIMSFFRRLENAGPAARALRENHKFYNTEKEKEILSSGYNFYWDLARELCKERVTVDLFACTNEAVDIPFLSPVY